MDLDKVGSGQWAPQSARFDSLSWKGAIHPTPTLPRPCPGGGQSGEFLLPFSEINPLLLRATEPTGLPLFP